MHLGLLYSRIRPDEKLLLEELRSRGHEVTKLDVRDLGFGLGDPPPALESVDIAFNRCLESSRVRYVALFLDHYDVPVVNPSTTTWVCADKVRGSLALADAGVATPKTEVTFDVESALESIERFGYPCVLKPVTGSWGRLIARIDTRWAAEAILEHKATLGHYEHRVFYVQEFVEKPDRDIRVVAADGEPIAAMTRTSAHWITNVARGGQTRPFEIDDEVRDLVASASAAVGGGLLGVDLMETGGDPDAGSGSEDRPVADHETEAERGGRYTVHEVNGTCEWKGLDEAVPDVDVPARIVDWIELRADEVAE